ncbi:LmbU family transcriptional regulator [Streptomyces hokutonensis]|uniref:LmbU family transcriptional regulator n=1 Tax=Streptomyces hokutonensis TaxID=1306990 RepID=UPI0006868EB2|nr:LmbU family transcriptional regulator [Streptomyces hokutonensis]
MNGSVSGDSSVLTRRVGLGIPAGLPFEEWHRVGQNLFLIADSSAWWLGDWLVYGEKSYPQRYRRAIDEARLDYQTLRNYAWVARNVALSRRRDKLSFQHHAEVASLHPRDQELWLQRAERLGWSRNKLRKAIRESRGGVPEPASPVRIVLNLPADRESLWREAAECSGASLQDWIQQVLDGAARSTVTGEEEVDAVVAAVGDGRVLAMADG